MKMIEVRTVDEFTAFLTLAKRGEMAIYHRGFLARDTRRPHVENTKVRQLAEAAKVANKNGIATLTQRRLGEGVYEYLAIRC